MSDRAFDFQPHDEPDEREQRILDRGAFMDAIARELDRAYAKHGAAPWGRHEFYGIIDEEYEEMKEAIFRDHPQDRLLAEMVQVAAMCFRYYETGDRYRGEHPGTRRALAAVSK